MTTPFEIAIQKLHDVNMAFSRKEVSAFEHGRQREMALAEALFAAAKEHGVTLQKPLQIDSNGEFRIVAMPADGGSPDYGCGPFGETFAALLGKFRPRTGIVHMARIEPENGWCRMNHFDVEALIGAHASSVRPQQHADDAVGDDAGPNPGA